MLQYSMISHGSEGATFIMLFCEKQFEINVQLHHSFYECGRTQEHNIINIDLKAIVAFFLEWR